MRRAIRAPQEETAKVRESIADARSEFDTLVQNAVERVFRALDLPRKSDIEALTDNLDRVAKAMEQLEPSQPLPPPQRDERPERNS